MPGATGNERPTSSRPFFSWRAHLPFLCLLAVAAPLVAGFVWHRGLSTMSDDSFSYLTLARWILPGDSALDPWAWQHAHLPPLFPLALAVTGAANDFLRAHLLVGAFALAALPLIYVHASRRIGRPSAGLVLVAAFLVTPTAWIGIHGILSESLFLLVTFAALWLHATRLEGRVPGIRDLLALGVLLGLACLTRATGWALVIAYLAHAGARLIGRRELEVPPLLLPVLPVAILVLAWAGLRPGGGEGYTAILASTLAGWIDAPAERLPFATALFIEGWIASMQAETATGALSSRVFAVLLAFGVGGAMLQAARNRLDGWYVLATLALTFFWMYPQDATRRLLYPVVPLLLLHAAELVLALCRRLAPVRRLAILAAAAALPVALCIPAALLIFQKALVREPVPGTTYAYAHITEYYRFVNEAVARSIAGQALATLAGFDALKRVTPPGSRVMWMRPEYIALLGEREPAVYENRWDALELARGIRREGVGYVVYADEYKVDVNMTMRHPAEVLGDLPEYSREVVAILNPATRRRAFVLHEVDPALLDAYIARRERYQPAVAP